MSKQAFFLSHNNYERALPDIFWIFLIMKEAILFLSLFIGANCSYLGFDCHLNKTRPDLVFKKCQIIEVNDLTSFCPIFDSNLCSDNPCFCDPAMLPTSFPCPENYVCIWSKKSDPSPSGQKLSKNAKIAIGIGVSAFLLLGIGISICVYRWRRVCFQVVTPSNLRFNAVFHSNSDTSTIHCTNNDEIDTQNTP